MCLICTSWDKEKMTSEEAMRALGELIDDGTPEQVEHYLELSSRILDKEVPIKDTNPELDRIFVERNRKDNE